MRCEAGRHVIHSAQHPPPPTPAHASPPRSNGDGYTGVYADGANICIAFSIDQRDWRKASTPLYAHGMHPAGLDAYHAHKVWLTAHPITGVLYMYYTGVYEGGRGILLLTSQPV